MRLFLLSMASPRCQLDDVWIIAGESIEEIRKAIPEAPRGPYSSAIALSEDVADYTEMQVVIRLGEWS